MNDDKQTPTPLSLQNQCFLYLICHITSFPIVDLSLLPKHISFKLMKNLPAANISWLESTDFVHNTGIDIQAVWGDVFMKRMPTASYEWPMRKYFDDSQFLGSWKDHYMLRVFTALLNQTSGSEHQSYKEFTFPLLFSVKECLGVFDHIRLMGSSHYTLDDSSESITPLGYDKWWDLSDTGILQLAVQECCYRPKELHIICNLFSRGSIYFGKGKVGVFRDVLSHMEELKLSCYTVIDRDPSFRIPLYVIETIIVRGKSKLRNFLIDAPTPTLEDILLQVAPLFYNSSYQFRNYSTPSGLPCSDLEKLVISSHSAYNQLTRIIYTQLAQLIQNQPKLQHIHLDGPFLMEYINNTLGTKQFLQSLSGFIMQPCFSKITLELRNISIQVAQQLLHTFLISPSTQVVQRFILNDVALRDDLGVYRFDLPFQIIMDDSGLEYKSVQFHDVSPLSPILESLLSVPYLRLSALDITTFIHVYYGVDILGMVARHSNFQLKQLNVYAKLPKTPSTTHDVETILQKPELQTFDIYDCMDANSYTSLLSLSDIAYGLLKQASVGHLCQLSLEKNRLGQCPDVELQFFFDALFSFPSLGQLGVNLRRNEFTAHHVMLFYDAWRSKGGGKCLRRLDYLDNEVPENTWYLEQVASIVEY